MADSLWNETDAGTAAMMSGPIQDLSHGVKGATR